MVEDNIAGVLRELAKLRAELKDVKKDIKFEEKITDEESYTDLKKALKDLKEQVKDFEDKWKRDLLDDDSYLKLKELNEKKEEDIANENAKLFKLIAELPPKPFEMKLETENGPVQINIQPEMRCYLNGKEERKRSAV